MDDIRNKIVVIKSDSEEELLHQRNEIEMRINDNSILLLLVCINTDLFQAQSIDIRINLYDWLINLPVLTAVIDEGIDSCKQLEFLMMFDWRFTSNAIVLQRNMKTTDFVFPFDNRYELLLGKKAFCEYKDWLMDDISTTYISKLGKVMNDSDSTVLEEVITYFEQIFLNKEVKQIRSMMYCFNKARTAKEFNKTDMLLEESIQFCTLINNC